MKTIKKVLSLFLVCVILSNLMWFNANADVGSNIEWLGNLVGITI